MTGPTSRNESDGGPQALREIANGYRAAQGLFTATRLGVFAALDKSFQGCASLARALELDGRATRMLCDALVALGLLRKHGNRYANSDTALRFLLPDTSESQVDLILHDAHLYDRWSRLKQTASSGKPPSRRRRNARRFAAAMTGAARTEAAATAAAVDLERVRRILDIGGGPGVYAIELAKRKTDLEVVVLDDADTLSVTRKTVAAAGLSERITLQPGDAFKNKLGRGFDLILISNIVHMFPASKNARLIGKAATALAPGGHVCVKDFLLNATRTGPPHAALFAVNMLVSTDAGDCYSLPEVQQWLRKSGLTPTGSRAINDVSTLVFGRKSAA